MCASALSCPENNSHQPFTNCCPYNVSILSSMRNPESWGEVYDTSVFIVATFLVLVFILVVVYMLNNVIKIQHPFCVIIIILTWVTLSFISIYIRAVDPDPVRAWADMSDSLLLKLGLCLTLYISPCAILPKISSEFSWVLYSSWIINTYFISLAIVALKPHSDFYGPFVSFLRTQELCLL